MIFLPAFVLGLLSSLHCVGMCGPIAMAVPSKSRHTGDVLLGSLLYNVGRLLTYMVLGLGVGIIGRVVSIDPMQQGLAIGAGVILIVIAFVPAVSKRVTWLEQRWGKLVKPVQRMLVFQFKRKHVYDAQLFIGILNGFLPCTTVIIALGVALSFGGWQESAVFMFFYALGTWPLMIVVQFGAKHLPQTWQLKAKKLWPYGMACVGVLLLLRGMDITPAHHLIHELLGLNNDVELCK